MPNRVCCWVAITTLSLVACLPLLTAQESSQHDWYAPLTNGDGLRYPLEIGPLTLHVVGSGIYPAKGSDGLIHLAYALQVTNSWNVTATIKSVEVDPAHGNQISGNNRVLDIKNEDVTGRVKLFTLPGTMNKESYTTQIPSGQSGVMFFDVTFDNISQVPKVIAHRITVTTPPTPVGTEHTSVSHSIPVGREAIVISPPLKGSGWVDGNGCCLEIQLHVGDYVRQGQKLGLLGNTGNSSAPHLHFQVMDSPSSLDDTSLPFVFDHMKLEGRVSLDLTALDENTGQKIAISLEKNEAKALTRAMPLSRDVEEFQ